MKHVVYHISAPGFKGVTLTPDGVTKVISDYLKKNNIRNAPAVLAKVAATDLTDGGVFPLDNGEIRVIPETRQSNPFHTR
jgi:hypothetical protein